MSNAILLLLLLWAVLETFSLLTVQMGDCGFIRDKEEMAYVTRLLEKLRCLTNGPTLRLWLAYSLFRLQVKVN